MQSQDQSQTAQNQGKPLWNPFLVLMMLWGSGEMKWDDDDQANPRASAITNFSMNTSISGFFK